MNGSLSTKEVLERLAELESLVEEQQETIERQRERIADLETAESDSPGMVVTDGGDVKVIGEIGADDATGVLGKTTGSGATYGVRGEATSSNGYGLKTPNDASIDGVAELGGIGGALTDNTPITELTGDGLTADSGALARLQLPAYDAIDTTGVGTITKALQEQFRPPLWGDIASTGGRYTAVTAGDTIPSFAFFGATLTPDGQVVFGPFDAGEVGVFEPGTGSEPEEVALHPLVNQ